MASKLITENLPGNLHEAANTINRSGLADYVMVMNFNGNNTVVVFKMPEDMAIAYSEFYKQRHPTKQSLQCFMTWWQNAPAETPGKPLKITGILENGETINFKNVDGLFAEGIDDILEPRQYLYTHPGVAQ